MEKESEAEMHRHDSRFYSLWIEDGILHLKFHRPDALDNSRSADRIRVRREITGNRPYPMLYDMSVCDEMPIATRNYLASKKSQKGLSAIAIVASTAIAKMMATFYVNVHSHNIPIKVFTDDKEALAWVREYKV